MVDVLNEVGNNYAISSDGIATALQDSASALMEGGNNLAQATALVAAANKVVQDPNSVGSALRTISLRLRGTSVEVLEEMGEETDGVVESTSKLQEKIKALTGVDIVDMNGAYKDTYTILKEIGSVWQNLDPMDQAAALELMAGKNRANTLAAILNNMQDLEGAYESALNAEGSALRENEAYLDSIQGRIDLFNNSVQTMWMNAIDSDAVKMIVDLATGVIKLVDAFGLIPSAVGVFAGYKIIANDLKKIFDGTTVSTKQLKQQLSEYLQQQRDMVKTSKDVAAAKQVETTAINETTIADDKESVKSAQNAIENTKQAGASKQVTQAKKEEQIQLEKTAGADQKESNASASNSASNATSGIADGLLKVVGFGQKAITVIKTLGAALGKVFLIMAVTEIAVKAIGAAFDWIDYQIHRVENIRKEVEELTDAYETAKESFDEKLEVLTTSSDTSVYKDLQTEFAALANGVDKYGNNISLTTDEYERYKEICDKIVGVNPKIASGYDSNTKAIGNNVNILEKLIELQKIEARNNAKEYLSDENLNKIAENAKNAVNEASKEYLALQFVQDDLAANAANNISQMFAPGKYSDDLIARYGESAEDKIKNILNILGYNNIDAGKIATEYSQNVPGFEFTDFLKAYMPEIYDNVEAFALPDGTNPIKEALETANYNYKDLSPYVDELKTAQDGLRSALAQVIYAEDESYSQLNSGSQNFIADWINNATQFKIDPSSTIEEVKTQTKDSVDVVTQMIKDLAKDTNMQEALAGIYEVDPATLNWSKYTTQINNAMEEFWTSIGAEKNKYGMQHQDLAQIFGFDFNTAEEQIAKATEQIAGHLELTSEQIQQRLNGMNAKQIRAYYSIDWNAVDWGNVTSWEDVVALVNKQAMSLDDIISVQTYSVLTAEIEKYNEVLKQTEEIVLDNTKVTQEYKDSLIELGISQDELNEYFYESDPLIVKNAKGLNTLVKAAKNNTAQNAKLAKSQARLQYRELYKELKQLTNGQRITNAATLERINSIYKEMSALQKSISKYTLLETKLLGAANAYDELAKAQEFDTEFDYGTKAEEMVNVLAEAFNTAELGTEAAQVAIRGLIPDEVIDKTKTLDEQMQQIYDYFTGGTVSKLFTIEFDDEGGISSVEMTKENIESFVNELLNNPIDLGNGTIGTIFTGTWDEFNLNPAITSLEEFADACGVTEEVAFAFLSSLEKYDISWLGGDISTLLDQLMGDDLEYKTHKTTEALAELEYQMANGQISIQEYLQKTKGLTWMYESNRISSAEYEAAVADLDQKLADGTTTVQEYEAALKGLNTVQQENNQAIVNNTMGYIEASQKVATAQQVLENATNELESAVGMGASTEQIQNYQVAVDEAAASLSLAISEKNKFEEPTEMALSIALDNITTQLEQWKLEHSTIDVEAKLYADYEQDEEGQWVIKPNVVIDSEFQEYVNLLNEQHTITTYSETDDAKSEMEDLIETVEDAKAAVQAIPSELKLDASVAISSLNRLITRLKTVQQLATDTNVELDYSGNHEYAPGQPSSTGMSTVDAARWRHNNAVYAHGTETSNGAPNTETALVGELGTELLVRDGKWFTVGENGAEFTQVRRGDIIFDHEKTKKLLTHGHVAGRGKIKGGNAAFAHGTAYPTGSINTFDDHYGTLYQDYSNTTSDLSNAADDISDAADEFREVFDWIEVRLEEINEQLSLKGAQLENAVGHTAQNEIVSEMIALNRTLKDNLEAAADEYYTYAAKLLEQIPETYQTAAQNGAIAIETFVGEVDEKTLEAIQEYRDWVQKGADVTQQAEEAITEIRSLAKQAFDNIITDFENDRSLTEGKISQFEAYNALLETTKGFEAEGIYDAIIKANNENLTSLRAQLEEMQAELDSSDIEVDSDEWYEAVNAIADTRTEIIELETEVDNLRDSINELHWQKFELLIKQFQNVSDEAENLIDILATKDAVDDLGNWTDEGVAQLGLLAQKMEVAEKQAEKYKNEIEYLEANWEKLGYTQEEYIDKLDELKDGLFDSIDAYGETKDAIVDLNKARVDAVKDGISKEIDAYEELINKKKELLNNEKD